MSNLVNIVSAFPGLTGSTRGSRWRRSRLCAALLGKVAARVKDPAPTKARRRGGGRSAAGPPVYLTEASRGTQDRSMPRPVSAIYITLL